MSGSFPVNGNWSIFLPSSDTAAVLSGSQTELVNSWEMKSHNSAILEVMFH